MAKLIKVWDGSAWQTVGTASTVGAQGTTGTQGTLGTQGTTGAQGTTGTATSSSITTWVKTAAGGETSLTGSSDSSTTLAYTAGQEQLFINGVLQVRGSDYTATNGTSITGLTALVAGDIATVTSVNAFSVTGAVPLSTVTANGDLIVGTSSGAVGRLGIGSTDQVLKVSGGVPTWATPAAGGKVLQVVNASTSTQVTNATSTYVDTNLTATITPTLSTSKVLVLVSQNGVGKNNGDSTNGCNIRLLRTATTLGQITHAGWTNTAMHNNIGGISFCYLDSPATTSATTYKTTVANNVNLNGAVVQWGNIDATTSYITLIEIGA